MELPQPRSLFAGNLLPCSEYAVLYGQSGLGKTMLELQLADALVRGGLFLGIETIRTRVLILSLELGRTYVRQRLRAITGEHYPSKLAAGLAVVACDQLPSGLNLNSEADQRKVLAWVKNGNFGLVIVDPLSLCYRGSEFIEDLSRVLQFLKMLAAQTGCVVLITHHEPKSQKARADDDMAALRGAAQIGDYAATLMRLKTKGGGLQLRFPKVRYASRPDPIWIERTESGLLVPTTPPADAQVEVRRDEIRRLLAELGELSARVLAQHLGVEPKTITNDIRQMGDVVRQGKGPATRYGLVGVQDEPNQEDANSQ